MSGPRRRRIGSTELVRLSLIFLLVLVGCGGPTPPSAELPATNLPQTMLWTWERPEDVSLLGGRQDVGVAHLVSTIELLASNRFDARPNRNPLRLPDETPRIAVVRIENVQGQRVVTRLDVRARRELVSALVDASAKLNASGLQLDFDALHSQRELYRELLVALREELPQDRSLGVTALASWCVGDPWLDDLPAGTVDYAIPMLFRMGSDASKIRRFAEGGGVFRSSLCRRDVGLSTDEPRPVAEEGVRRWIFSPAAWTNGQALNRI